MAFYIDRKAGPQVRASIVSRLVAKCFRLLPQKDEKRPVWMPYMVEKRQG